MKLVKDKISVAELREMSKRMTYELVKAVVDLEQQIMVVDAPMHADEERFLLEEHESKQGDLWGINLYPNTTVNDEFIEFDSMINIRPGWGNRSKAVEDPKTQERIKLLVNKLVQR